MLSGLLNLLSAIAMIVLISLNKPMHDVHRQQY